MERLDCSDKYTDDMFKKLCTKLEEGKTIEINVSSLDENINHIESAHYASNLYDKYNGRLERVKDAGKYYTYRLKTL